MLKTYREINELYHDNAFPERTEDPLFHIFNMDNPYPTLVRAMPPHILQFYQVGFQQNMPGTQLSLQASVIRERTNLLYFAAPGQVISWVRGEPTVGHIFYFKPKLLDFYPVPLLEEFPFLQLHTVNVTEVSADEGDEFHQDLSRLCAVMTQPIAYRRQIIQSGLLGFLFRCKGVFERAVQQQALLSSAQQLTGRFRQLVNQYFVQQHQIGFYADWLHVSPDYLSSVLRQTTGRSAKALLNERRLQEAQNLLRYTSADISIVADQLGYGELTHFTRFFRQQTGLTPSEFRHANQRI